MYDKGKTSTISWPYCIWCVFQLPRGKQAETNVLLGWDSSFEYEGQTYAEMDKTEKNKISHRAKALEKLKAWLREEVPES